jgi:hypothetical protein
MGARIQRQAKLHNVYRSDFMQDPGTPLQWAIAWETVAEREATAREIVDAVVVLSWWLVIAAARA